MSQTIAHSGAETHAGTAHHHELSFFNKYIWSEDHKTIAIQYLFASLFFLLIGGLLAMGVRYQLAFSGNRFPLFGGFCRDGWSPMQEPFNRRDTTGWLPCTPP